MKLSKPLCALILIASALLLSAAESEPVKPIPKSTRSHKSESPQIAQKANEGQTVQGNPEVAATPAHETQIQTPNLNQDQSDSDRSAQKEATYTGLLVIVGFAAVVISIVSSVFSYRAAQAAADAARDSAKSTRPFLFVMGVRCPYGLKLLHRTGEVFYTFEFEIDVRNFGLAPADIFDYDAGAVPMDRDIRQQPLVEPQIKFADVIGNRLNDPLIGSEEIAEARIRATATLTTEQNDAVRNNEKGIAIYGIIRYRGATTEAYWTKFFWWCFLDAGNNPCNMQRAIRPDLNDHT